MLTETANLPLHFGAYPSWLFTKMIEFSSQAYLVITSKFRAGNVNAIQKLNALV